MGSEQFLGRQLAEQTIALTNLVNAMSNVVVNTGNSVPMFAKVSNAVKYDSGTITMALQASVPLTIFTCFLTGTIRVRYLASGAVITWYKNGVAYKSGVGPIQTPSDITVMNNQHCDIIVKEGDQIQVYLDSTGYPLQRYVIQYDDIIKPSILTV